MVGFCLEDSWIDDAEQNAFILYGVHPVEGQAAQVGFAVDLKNQMVRAARLLITVPGGIRSEPVETLPRCPVSGQHAVATTRAVGDHGARPHPLEPRREAGLSRGHQH